MRPQFAHSSVSMSSEASRRASSFDAYTVLAIIITTCVSSRTDLIEARLEEIAALESRDTGKPFRLAATVDVPPAIANFRFFASAARQHHDGSHEMANAINYTLR